MTYFYEVLQQLIETHLFLFLFFYIYFLFLFEICLFMLNLFLCAKDAF